MYHEYMHAKTILANRVPIDKDEIFGCIIDGIAVASLRDQARIGKFTSKTSLRHLRKGESKKENSHRCYEENGGDKWKAASGC